MSEYWKSNPRKFCDFCKCWIADNKPSVEFHERGKRHKESVQKRLAEMGRKGQEDYEAKMQEGDFLKAMEEAAMKAYKTDIEQNPDMTGTKISEIAKASNAELVVGKMKATSDTHKEKESSDNKKDSNKSKLKKWNEVGSPDGQSYYWNTETGETKWEAPEEGYVSLTEQKDLKNKNSNSSNKSKSTSTNTSTSSSAPPDPKPAKKKKTSSSSSAPVVYGPAPKKEVYSSWKTIEIEPEQPKVDLQLPQLEEEEYYGPELVIKNPVSSFKVKTVTLGTAEQDVSSSVGFKKRKGSQDSRKIMRRRNDL